MYYKAVWLHAQGRTQERDSLLKRLRQYEPAVTLALQFQLFCCVQAADFVRALHIVNTNISLVSKCPSCLVLAAFIFYRSRKYRQAERVAVDAHGLSSSLLDHRKGYVHAKGRSLLNFCNTIQRKGNMISNSELLSLADPIHYLSNTTLSSTLLLLEPADYCTSEPQRVFLPLTMSLFF
eukprot:TRINITY_DN34738_c0_g1_i1.p1 TRINITY_DN34738_c0_g1~~TRINITY_DN34738_c0_g1_i1.p1  ORF type:complete len:179 (+),score=14.70 TRINITY_DN34738_c0_g1_i1:284-820(+)